MACMPNYGKNKYMNSQINKNEINCPYELSISTDEECEQISNEVMYFNARAVPFTQMETPILKNYVLKDNNKIIAGINACVYCWGILYINPLFVDENYRGRNLGGYLLDRVEQEAKAMRASLSHLDTFDFQAKDFYLKQGYEIFGVLENCPP